MHGIGFLDAECYRALERAVQVGVRLKALVLHAMQAPCLFFLTNWSRTVQEILELRWLDVAFP